MKKAVVISVSCIMFIFLIISISVHASDENDINYSIESFKSDQIYQYGSPYVVNSRYNESFFLQNNSFIETMNMLQDGPHHSDGSSDVSDLELKGPRAGNENAIVESVEYIEIYNSDTVVQDNIPEYTPTGIIDYMNNSEHPIYSYDVLYSGGYYKLCWSSGNSIHMQVFDREGVATDRSFSCENFNELQEIRCISHGNGNISLISSSAVRAGDTTDIQGIDVIMHTFDTQGNKLGDSATIAEFSGYYKLSYDILGLNNDHNAIIYNAINGRSGLYSFYSDLGSIYFQSMDNNGSITSDPKKMTGDRVCVMDSVSYEIIELDSTILLTWKEATDDTLEYSLRTAEIDKQTGIVENYDIIYFASMDWYYHEDWCKLEYTLTTLADGNIMVVFNIGYVKDNRYQRHLGHRVMDQTGTPTTGSAYLYDENRSGRTIRTPLELIKNTDGDYALVWAEYERGIGSDIKLQQYDSSGNTIGGIKTINHINQEVEELENVVLLANGNLLISWIEYSRSSASENLAVQVCDFNGVPLADKTILNLPDRFSVDDEGIRQVLLLSNGNFALTWIDCGRSGHIVTPSLYVNIYDTLGKPVGQACKVTDYLGEPTITNLKQYHDHSNMFAINDDSFALIWTHSIWSGAQYSPQDMSIRLQVFDNNGVKVNSEQTVIASSDHYGELIPKYFSIEDINNINGDATELIWKEQLTDQNGSFVKSNKNIRYISTDGILHNNYPSIPELSQNNVNDEKNSISYESMKFIQDFREHLNNSWMNFRNISSGYKQGERDLNTSYGTDINAQAFSSARQRPDNSYFKYMLNEYENLEGANFGTVAERIRESISSAIYVNNFNPQIATVSLREILSTLQADKNRSETDNIILDLAQNVMVMHSYLGENTVKQFEEMVNYILVAGSMHDMLEGINMTVINKALLTLRDDMEIIVNGYLNETQEIYAIASSILGIDMDKDLPDSYVHLADDNILSKRQIIVDVEIEKLSQKNMNDLETKEIKALDYINKHLKPYRDKHIRMLKDIVFRFISSVKPAIQGAPPSSVNTTDEKTEVIFVIDHEN